jgi:hypothetical protein
MNRLELQRMFRRHMDNVREHNLSNFVREQRRYRDSVINNAAGYHSHDRNHEVQSTQIDSWDTWNRLDELFQEGSNEMDYIRNPPANIRNLINLTDMGYGNFFGEVVVSLLREVNHETGIHRAVLMIYISPHRQFADGDILTTSFSYGDPVHEAMTTLFDESPYTMVEYLSEVDMIGFVQSHNDAQHLIRDYFQPGFTSVIHGRARPFIELDFPQVAIPPPPINNQYDLAYYFQQEMDNDPENNIIPYWNENDDEIQNVRG